MGTPLRAPSPPPIQPPSPPPPTMTAFRTAVMEGNDAHVTDILMELPVNARAAYLEYSPNGYTAIMHATNAAVITTLRQFGAKVEATAPNGDRAVHLLASHNSDAIQALIEPLTVDGVQLAGADVEAVRADGLRPMHIAADRHCPEAIRALRIAGADVNGVDTLNGYTPLHKAVDGMEFDSIESFNSLSAQTIKALTMTLTVGGRVLAGANLEARTPGGMTARELAVFMVRAVPRRALDAAAAARRSEAPPPPSSRLAPTSSEGVGGGVGAHRA